MFSDPREPLKTTLTKVYLIWFLKFLSLEALPQKWRMKPQIVLKLVQNRVIICLNSVTIKLVHRIVLHPYPKVVLRILPSRHDFASSSFVAFCQKIVSQFLKSCHDSYFYQDLQIWVKNSNSPISSLTLNWWWCQFNHQPPCFFFFSLHPTTSPCSTSFHR
jgi:hypothetical protein